MAKATAENDAGRLLHQGVAFQNAGDLQSAERSYLAVLKQRPRDPDALHLLGVLYGRRGDLKAGYAQIQKALAVRDDFSDAHVNSAAMAAQLGDLGTAERHLRRALQFQPALALAHFNLGAVLREQGRTAEAIDAFRNAIQFDPRDVQKHLELVRTMRIAGDLAGQRAAAEAALKIAPGHSVLELMLSEALFGLSDFKGGWRSYQCRFKSAENAVVPRNYPIPLWRGEPLAGRSILIWTEQGIGDEALYANMFTDVIATAQRCVIQCSPRMASLFRRSFPKAEIYDRDLSSDEIRGIDFQSPAASLGEWLRADIASFPRNAGYLTANAELRETLRNKYGRENLLVGFAWRSSARAHNIEVQNAADKSINLQDWGPIFQVPGVTFVNLQYGECAAELDMAAKGFNARIIRDEAVDPVANVDAYAAQIAAMDVVISSSNTAAHLAGALGVPTFCMLPISLGRGRRWYWFAEQGRCPWYPATQLFPQRRDRHWAAVIRDVGLALVDKVTERGVEVAPFLRGVAAAYAALMGSSGAEAADRRDDAEMYYRRLAREPGLAAEAYFRIADLRKSVGDQRGVIAACDEAIKADPTFWNAYDHKGTALNSLNLFDEAIETFRQGLAQNPQGAELHNNLATSFSKLGRESEAVAQYEKARAIVSPESPSLATIELNYAMALSNIDEMTRAKAILDALVERAPNDMENHFSRAMIGLSAGQLESWREYAWRLKRQDAVVPPQFRADVKLNPQFASFPGKPWDGEDLAGKNLLVWTEQGLGDELLATTMIPDAIAAARHVSVLCSERLVPLLRRSFPSATVEERKSPLPKSITSKRVDFQMSMSELGAAFRPSFTAFPAHSSFLRADAKRRDQLRSKYAAMRPGAPIVGLAWSSLKNPEVGWLKGPAFGVLAPILQTPGVTFVNLQYGDRSKELEWARNALGVDIVDDKSVDAIADVDGFAAQVAAMDLVISTSNTAVHVAGGLGIPTWVLLGEGRGRLWYWFRDRADSPWYPSIRLFRRHDSWQTSVETCAAAFREWCASFGKNTGK